MQHPDMHVLPAAVLLLADCSGRPAPMAMAQPQGCAAAANSVAANNPAAGTTLRITRAQVEPANADAAVGPNETRAWYRKVDARAGGRASDLLKLFVVPGMAHCSGAMATDP